MKTPYSIGIIVLLAAVVFAGYFLFKKPAPENQVPESEGLPPTSDGADTTPGDSAQSAKEVVTLRGFEEVFEVFGYISNIDGAEKSIGIFTSLDQFSSEFRNQEYTAFLGDNTQIFSYDADNPFKGSETFTPTGSEISFDNLNKKEYILISSDENLMGKMELRSIKFIQVLLPPDTTPEAR